jgi:tetratricopeptide (TPR) repeat protein
MNQKDSELKNLWLDKACMYWSTEKYDLADECFDNALALDREDPLCWYNKGTSLMHNEKYNDAICCFRKSLELDSNQFEAWANIAISYGMIGDDYSAFQCADKGLAINDTDPDLWHSRGVALQNLDRDSEAQFSFNRAEKFKKIQLQKDESKPQGQAINSNENLTSENNSVYGKKKKTIRSILGDIPNTEEAKSELFRELMRVEDSRLGQAEAALHARLSEDDREKAYKWSAYFRGLMDRDSEN